MPTAIPILVTALISHYFSSPSIKTDLLNVKQLQRFDDPNDAINKSKSRL